MGRGERRASWCQRGRKCERTEERPAYTSAGYSEMYCSLAHLLGSTSLGNGQRDAENSIGTELGLVGSAVETVEERVNLGLVLDIDALLDQSGADDRVDVLNSLGDTLATPLALVAIAKLAGFVLTC